MNKQKFSIIFFREEIIERNFFDSMWTNQVTWSTNTINNSITTLIELKSLTGFQYIARSMQDIAAMMKYYILLDPYNIMVWCHHPWGEYVLPHYFTCCKSRSKLICIYLIFLPMCMHFKIKNWRWRCSKIHQVLNI